MAWLGTGYDFKYNGVTNGGKFDGDIKKTDEYKTFQKSVQKTFYEVYQAWIRSATAAPGVMTMQTVAIWEMLSVASDPTLAARAADFENAYKWIVKNPATHRTKCRFTVNSDWAELVLLTPVGLYTSESRLSQTSRLFERQQTIDFIIINEGSPVDIMLSHGSDGDTAGSGKCAVSMVGKNYENTGVKGNNWNS
ncbi:hypothetical protein AYO22_03221 [Fonsecaea multimorphosa]|nr:hypothetical protein AYO22_03221 [Fonsecaea multimorphosa]